MKNTSQSQNRLKWQITKYDSLKFSLKVRVKNSKCSSILLLRQMFPQDPKIPLFSMSACNGYEKKTIDELLSYVN